MAKGGSSGQASNNVSSSGAQQAAYRKAMGNRPERGTVRNTGAEQSSRTAGRSAGELKFYTEDAPGLKIGPSTVLVLSLSYIAIVVILHIFGKVKSG
jgi:protein transport protein SEC61 subunit beta